MRDRLISLIKWKLATMKRVFSVLTSMRKGEDEPGGLFSILNSRA